MPKEKYPWMDSRPQVKRITTCWTLDAWKRMQEIAERDGLSVTAWAQRELWKLAEKERFEMLADEGED